MKRAAIVLLVLVSLFSVSAFAKGTPAKSHGKQIAGSIKSVDDSAKSLVLQSGGKDLTIYWTDATKVTGGKVMAGEHATIRAMEKDGKWWATSVKVTGKSS